MKINYLLKAVLSISTVALILSGSGVAVSSLSAKDPNPWGGAAISWVTSTGLTFAGSEVISALGLSSQPEYVEQLNKLIDITKDINLNLDKVNQNLNNLDGDLKAIFSLMVKNKYDESAAFFELMYTKEDTTWSGFENNVATLSNEEIVNSPKALKALRNSVFKDAKLSELSEDSAKLSGISATGQHIKSLEYFISSRSEYRDNVILTLTRGVRGKDAISKIDSSNEELMSSLMTIAIHLQRIYAMEALGIYLQANAGSMDEQNGQYYSVLTVKEEGISINYNFEENMSNLNLVYDKKFKNLLSIINQKGNIISDNNSSYISSKEYLEASLPVGDWKDESTLYAWSGVFPEENVLGYYDGLELKVNVGAKKDQDSLSSIDISNCYENNNLITTTTETPYLECKYLDTSKFMSVYSTDDIFGFTTWVESSSQTAGNTYNLADQKIIYNKDRISIEGESNRAIDKDGSLHYETHHRENRIIQYNYTNGERALFQFSTTHHKKFMTRGHEQIGVGCGKESGAYWSCANQDSNENSFGSGGHSALTLTSKSGKEVRVFVGGQGTESNRDVSKRHAYLDTCISEFNKCGSSTGPHQ